MKYKNIIFLLCDSLTFVDNEYLHNKLKFIDKYKENTLVFDNIFSQGPYTEAAVNALLTSTSILNYEGYFQNLNRNVETITEMMKSEGYKTYATEWSYCNSEGFFRGVDKYVYVSLMNFEVIYNYRVKYIKELYKKNTMSEYHLTELTQLISDFFLTAQRFIDDYYFNRDSFIILNKIYDIDENYMNYYKEIVLEDKKEFENNKKRYIENLLNEKVLLLDLKRPLRRENKIYKELKRKINKKCISISILELTRIIINSKKNKSIRCIKEKIRNTSLKEINKTIKQEIMYTLNYTGIPIYSEPSATSIFNEMTKYITCDKAENKFVFSHIMDNHFPFNFFSYDIESLDILKKEYEEFMKSRWTYKNNNYFYEQSISYVNDKIEKVIEDLTNKEIMNDTLLIVTADHGSSYLGKIYRGVKVSNEFDETYKVPFIIYNPTIRGRVNHNYGSNIDIIPTIMEVANLKYNKKNVEGMSLIDNKREYVFFEYMGAGCPDMCLRDKCISIRSERYKVNCKIKNNTFSYESIDSIYNLETDENELENIKDEYIAGNVLINNNLEVVELLDALKNRILELKSI